MVIRGYHQSSSELILMTTALIAAPLPKLNPMNRRRKPQGFRTVGRKIPLFLRTDRILFRGTVDDDAKKIRSERLIQKPETTVAALGQGNARGHEGSAQMRARERWRTEKG